MGRRTENRSVGQKSSTFRLEVHAGRATRPGRLRAHSVGYGRGELVVPGGEAEAAAFAADPSGSSANAQ